MWFLSLESGDSLVRGVAQEANETWRNLERRGAKRFNVKN